MKYELDAADGILEFEYLWPIRGSYEIVMSASPTARSPVQFEPISEATTFRLTETPRNCETPSSSSRSSLYRPGFGSNTWAVAQISAGAGVMRGPMMAVGAVIAVAVLLLVGILLSIEFGLAGSEEYVAGAPMTFESSTGELTLMATLDPEVPAVGQLALLTGALTDAPGNQVEDVQFEVAAFHLEDEKT